MNRNNRSMLIGSATATVMLRALPGTAELESEFAGVVNEEVNGSGEVASGLLESGSGAVFIRDDEQMGAVDGKPRVGAGSPILVLDAIDSSTRGRCVRAVIVVADPGTLKRSLSEVCTV